MDNGMYSISVLDFVILAGFLVLSATVGVFYGCIRSKQKTTGEYFMANKEMSVLPVSLSLLASFMSAITVLGTSSEVYVYGTEYSMLCLAYFIVVPVAAHIFLPVFHKIQIVSVFEYLERRFHSKALRVFVAAIYIIQMILYMAIVLYAPSLALSAVTGINIWSIVIPAGVVCTFYTALGGMKAVMWTDVFQIIMMLSGLFAVLIKGCIDFGGLRNIWRINEEGQRVEFIRWYPNPLERHNIWTLTFGGAITSLAVYGVNQAQVQRALCTPTLRQGQIALWVNLPGLSVLLILGCMCGMVVYAQYANCDPLSTGKIGSRDQLLPFYVMDKLSIPGLPGLFIACLFSGALSTISSGLNSLSAVTLKDMVTLICFKNLSDRFATFVTKLIAVAYGVLMILLTFIVANLGGVLQAALGLFGMLGGPIMGLFILGMFFPCSNKKGAFAGFIVSLTMTIWIGAGAIIYKPFMPRKSVSTMCSNNISYSLGDGNYSDPVVSPQTELVTISEPTSSVSYDSDDIERSQSGYLHIYELSYLWYSGFAVAVLIPVALLVSCLTGLQNTADLDPVLLSPLVGRIYSCVPKKLGKPLLSHPIKSDSKKNQASNLSSIAAADVGDDIPVNKENCVELLPQNGFKKDLKSSQF